MAIINFIQEKFKFKVKLFIFGFCLISFNTVYAQQKKIDSLNNLINQHPKQDDVRADHLINYSALIYQSKPKEALKNANEIISYENKIINKVFVARAYRIKSMVSFLLSQFSESIVLINKALTIDKSIKNDAGIALDYNILGSIYVSQSKFSEALNPFLEAYKKFDLLKLELNAATVLANIGTIYNEMGDYKQAMSNYEKSNLIFKKSKYFLGQASMLANISTVLSKEKKFDDAIRYSNQALKLSDSIGDERGIALVYGNLSGFYDKIQKFDLALDHGLKAIELNKKLGNKKSLGVNYQNVSSAYVNKKNYKQAKIYALIALNIGKELNVTEIKRDASLGLSEVYEKTNMTDSSLYYYKNFTKYADSISNDDKKAEITKMGMRYEFDKKELTYKQNEFLSDNQLKHQSLQIALNNATIQKGLQLQDIQRISLENEKLNNQEKQKQLIISKSNEKLQLSKLSALAQEQKLSKLELNQFWLFGILAVVILLSVLIYLLNLYRIRKLRFKNVIQKQEAEQRATILKHENQLSESELKAIRSQMNPHFIFNVLNSIEAYIMDNDKKTASRLIQKFASLSRLILENSTKSLVNGDKEWKALMLYAELEAMRYNNLFSYEFIVDDEVQLKTLLLPPMLIQPLIENAILHGLIIDNKADAHLEVKLEKIDTGICVTITDNGFGINNNSKQNKTNYFKEKSMGLESIRERIDMINIQNPSVQAKFEITGGLYNIGTLAKIYLPILQQKIMEIE